MMMEARPSALTWPLYELTGVDEGWEDGLIALLSGLHQHPEWTSGRQDSHQICNHTNKPEQGMMGNNKVFSVAPFSFWKSYQTQAALVVLGMCY